MLSYFLSRKSFSFLPSSLLTICLFLGTSIAQAAVIEADLDTDIRSTKHNLSITGTGTLKSTTESRVCVFCHTPHAGTVNGGGEASAPLWNRTLSDTAVYTEYDSPSLDAADPGKPSGSSRMCLSCHDGALVIGNVNYAYQELNKSFTMTGTDGDGTMTSGPGDDTGFTRNLDVNLTNDHPISFTFDAALATADTELRDPTTSDHLGNRVQGQPKHIVPLEDGKVQCISCHDPHIPKEKFLRLNRNQANTHPTAGSFDKDNDIVCLACHEKDGWSTSAHAHSDVANETYTLEAATTREFTAGVQVWQAACLNCHDTHTVPGARMLLREGTDAPLVNGMKNGGNAAQEQTCYQCHNVNGGPDTILQGGMGNEAPDIKSEFERAYHKPISNTDQGQAEELHRITNADFIEETANLGLGTRHAECTDCHNPHRIIKNNTFNADPTIPDGEAHHDHTATLEPHSNIASGALAGTWGVEPVYAGTAFGDNPVSFDIKSGYAGVGGSTLKTATHVTREYQICLKCHSNFAYGASPPTSGPTLDEGLMTNGLTQYTNQAMEFQAPVGDMGENIGASGAAANHRSWHPVMDNTGRDYVQRSMTSQFGSDGSIEMWNAPWKDTSLGALDRVGVQTMYCSDCHGSAPAYSDADTSTHSVEPETDAAWGPHGSDNAFILKGNWSHGTGQPDSDLDTASQLCFRCHNVEQYSPVVVDTATTKRSGFATAPGYPDKCSMNNGPKKWNLHVGHRVQLGKRMRCTWCHVAVPHGWRNKALLVNLDVDPEAADCQAVRNVMGGVSIPCDAPPYYQKAYLGGNTGGINWKPSGQWTAGDCGGGAGGWMTAGAANSGCGNPQ